MIRLEREIIAVTGKSGFGKTLWTRRHIRSHPRVIILDPMLEYDGELFDDLNDMIDHIESRDLFTVRAEFADDAKILAKIAMAAGECHHPQEPMPHKGCRNVTLVIDEAGRALPSRALLDPAIEDVIYRGRHRHVTVINVTQRASTLNIAARSQWTRLITFWQTETADVKWIQDQAGAVLPIDELDQLEFFDITPTSVRRGRIGSPTRTHEEVAP